MSDFDRMAVAFLGDLVRCRTVNPPGQEAAAAHLVADRLRSLGLASHLVDLGDERANLVAVVPGRGLKPPLVFCGHLDVVAPGEEPWEHDPFGAQVVAGRMYGRGTTDMKSGTAALVLAAALVHQEKQPLAGDLVLLCTAGEEAGCFGARHYAGTAAPPAVSGYVVAEPTELNLTVAEKGALWLELTTRGRTSHGSRPDKGINAAEHMVRLVEAFAAIWRFGPGGPPPPARIVTSHPLLSPPTMNLGYIQAGLNTNVVPDRCIARIDLRTLPGQDHGEVLRLMQAVVGRVKAGLPELQAQVQVINDLPAVSTPAEHPLVAATATAVQAVTGRAPAVKGNSGYTDAAVLSATGQPFVICGPGEVGLAHQPNEFVRLDCYLQAIEVFRRLAHGVLG